MKTNLMLLGAAIAMSQSAFAQSSSSVSIPSSAASAPAANASTAEASAVGADAGVKPKITYLGIVHGPGLNSDNFAQDSFNDDGAVMLEHRLRLLAQTSENVNMGLETRFYNNLNGDNGGVDLLNGDYRAVVNFKHVYKDSLVDIGITPRLKLPTSNASRNKQLSIAPELIFTADVSPSDSRLSFSNGILVQKNFYKDGASEKNLNLAIQPWVEADYQLSPAVQAMVAYWPELDSTSERAARNTSNELDIGANIEFIKGWTATPYIEVQPNGMDTQNMATAAKQLQFNFYVSGAFL